MPPGNFDSTTPGIPAVIASATAPGPGSNGVHGITSSNADSAGYFEHTAAGIGVFGRGGPNGGSGVHGASTGPDFPGVFGESAAGNGVVGRSSLAGGAGVAGSNDQTGGIGVSGSVSGAVGNGVSGSASGDGGIGVWGISRGAPIDPDTGEGLIGSGVAGRSNAVGGVGVNGTGDGVGVSGLSFNGAGVSGKSNTGAGIAGFSDNVAVYAEQSEGFNIAYLGTQINSGDFYGEVSVHGRLNKFGGGFRIDHPLDPAAKYFSHSFVESADMKNIYDGMVVLDAGGEAEIELPSWFDAVNCDFRYQLTCIGGYAPVYIAQEVQSNRFKIGGGAPGMKVSWQITGIRQDPWAKAHPLAVEEDKPADEQGYYLDPELYGVSGERNIRNARYLDIIRLASRLPQRRSR